MEFIEELIAEETWGGPEPRGRFRGSHEGLPRKQQTAKSRTDALRGGA